jgi:hypothetical protein
MNRKRVYTKVCLMPIILAGLLLTCGTNLSGANDEIALSASSASPASISQVLTRTFSLSIPLFAANSAWNQTATTADVLPESDQQILVTYRVLRGDTTDLYPPGLPPNEYQFPWVNYDEYTMPVFLAGEGQQSVEIRDYEGVESWPGPKFPDPQEGGPVTVPAPAGTVRPAGPEGTDSDGHLVLYDPATSTEYDFWQATTVRSAGGDSLGGGLTGTVILEAGAIDFFDVSGSGTNPDDYSSARAMGTPLLAGLLLPEDVGSGEISHALAFAIPGPRNLSPNPSEPLSSDYFYPASTTETDYYSVNEHALAAGQRIRLKQTLVDDAGSPVNESELAPITQMFLAALRTYGAYMVDNAGGFIFYAEDIHTANLDLTDAEVQTLIGEPSLPEGKTKWEIVIEALNDELGSIPFAYGLPFSNPKDATISAANFEMVEPATHSVTFTAVSTIYLPLVLNNIAGSSSGWWQPDVNTSWQWQLTDSIDQSFDVDMYDIDLFDNGAITVTALHAQGRKVVCYISVGSWEEWRPDADQFPDSVLGNDYEGWEGEKWLDIRRIDLLAPIMRARFDECKAKGFDGIEPDNIDGYTNNTGFPLTYQDQLNYNIWLANEAHERGLSIGLKNDDEQVADLLSYFDWALTEDCFADEWCAEMTPFIAAGKPVFAAEYTDQFTTEQFSNQVCPQAETMNFSTILKDRELNAWRQACP